MLSESDYISPEDLDIFTVVDKPKDATKIITNFRKAKGRSGLELPSGMKKT